MTPGAEALPHAIQRIFNENPPARIGVAVSGGGDSMALLFAAEAAFPGRVLAATVDHGLRPEARAEAEGVAAFCQARGIAHSILTWAGPQPGGNLMDQARYARLGLLTRWAQGQGVADVLLGHTADDQAETFLMNLARASGLDGLCGLRPAFGHDSVTFHRPFLHLGRMDLRDYLVAQGVGWVDDPSNQSDRFTRARVRKMLAVLAPLGLSVHALARTSRNLASAREALQMQTAKAAMAHVRAADGGLQLSAQVLAALPVEVRRRLMIAALGWIGGAVHPPREAKLQGLFCALQAGRDATLGGLRFRWRKEALLVVREPRAVMGPVPFGALWDHRWRVAGPALPSLEIRALGSDGLRLCPDWRGQGPRDPLIVSPAVWQGDRLIAAPLAGFGQGYTASLSQPFVDFILSH